MRKTLLIVLGVPLLGVFALSLVFLLTQLLAPPSQQVVRQVGAVPTHESHPAMKPLPSIIPSADSIGGQVWCCYPSTIDLQNRTNAITNENRTIDLNNQLLLCLPKSDSPPSAQNQTPESAPDDTSPDDLPF